MRPKSIAREMVERFMDFNEYVREYELGRAEGTLLRYLSDVYKALVQTVPAPAKTPEVEEIEVFLRAMVRAVDSSLLDEWERMLAGPEQAILAAAAAADEPARDRTSRATSAGSRCSCATPCSSCCAPLARRDWAAAAALFGAPVRGGRGAASASEDEWTAARFEQALAAVLRGARRPPHRPDGARAAEYARRPGRSRGTWEVVQVLCDPEGDDDWTLSVTVDLEASAKAGRPVLVMRGVDG